MMDCKERFTKIPKKTFAKSKIGTTFNPIQYVGLGVKYFKIGKNRSKLKNITVTTITK